MCVGVILWFLPPRWWLEVGLDCGVTVSILSRRVGRARARGRGSAWVSSVCRAFETIQALIPTAKSGWLSTPSKVLIAVVMLVGSFDTYNNKYASLSQGVFALKTSCNFLGGGGGPGDGTKQMLSL